MSTGVYSSTAILLDNLLDSALTDIQSVHEVSPQKQLETATGVLAPDSSANALNHSLNWVLNDIQKLRGNLKLCYAETGFQKLAKRISPIKKTLPTKQLSESGLLQKVLSTGCLAAMPLLGVKLFAITGLVLLTIFPAELLSMAAIAPYFLNIVAPKSRSHVVQHTARFFRKMMLRKRQRELQLKKQEQEKWLEQLAQDQSNASFCRPC